VKDHCPQCGWTMFKKSGRGAKKPYCINEECANFTPEDKRGGWRKAADKTEKEGAEKAEEKPAKKTAAKKTAAKKTAAKKTAEKKTAKGKTAAKKSGKKEEA